MRTNDESLEKNIQQAINKMLLIEKNLPKYTRCPEVQISMLNKHQELWEYVKSKGDNRYLAHYNWHKDTLGVELL